VLAAWQGTSFQAAYLLGSAAAGIAIGIVMLQSGSFGKPTAYAAILANAIGLGLYVPAVGVYIAVFSVLFLEVWYVLVARRLLQLGHGWQPAPGAALMTHGQGQEVGEGDHPSSRPARSTRCAEGAGLRGLQAPGDRRDRASDRAGARRARRHYHGDPS
jgi:hypothetical protein